MRWTVGPLVLALIAPTLAHAQAGVFAGLAVENGRREYGQGFSLVGSYTVGGNARLGLRFDLGVQAFDQIARTYIDLVPCPPTPQPCGGYTRGTSLTAISSTASVVFNEYPRAKNSFYWIVGLGAYALNDVPIDGAYTRFGWNGGGGLRIGSTVLFEFRYHSLINARGTRGFAPIAVGFRF